MADEQGRDKRKNAAGHAESKARDKLKQPANRCVRLAKLSPMEDGVRLTVVGSQAEADIICSLLRVNGISCEERAADVAMPGVGGSGGWREILVGEDQLEAARELLATRPPAG